jgi:hypothetical protein
MTDTSVAIVGIVVAGVGGPTLGYVASWLGDRRRFRHERSLKATDDLIARVDEVAAALETLAEKTESLRTIVFTIGLDPGRTYRAKLDAEDAYRRVRISIGRLTMRPHADRELTDAGGNAASRIFDAVKHASDAIETELTEEAKRRWITRQEEAQAEGRPPALPYGGASFETIQRINYAMDDGYALIVDFQKMARATTEGLLGSTPRRRALAWAAARGYRPRASGNRSATGRGGGS